MFSSSADAVHACRDADGTDAMRGLRRSVDCNASVSRRGTIGACGTINATWLGAGVSVFGQSSQILPISKETRAVGLARCAVSRRIRIRGITES